MAETNPPMSCAPIYVVDGKALRLCDCPLREGRCPRGVERELHTTEFSRCLVPAEGVVLASPTIGYALVEIATINNLTTRLKALADAGSADAKSLAADAALLLEARRG